MSKISIKGADTGTGVFTLESPATNTDRTLVLPDEAGTVLTTASTTVLPKGAPAFHVYDTSGQSISNSTFTKVTFNNETFDTDNMFASSTFTPTVAGYYQINGNVGFAGATTGYAQIKIYKNGSAFSGGSGIPNNNNIGGQVMVSSVVYCNGSTDYIELYAWQNSGGTLAFQTNSQANTFSGFLVRAD